MSDSMNELQFRKKIQARNIEQIIELDEKDKRSLTTSDRIADMITGFSGSMFYVVLHVIIFAGWIVWNSGLVGKAFDPFPFNLLTMVVSLEAIFLSSFVLISQNRQATQADKRAKLDLQINMLAEEENTKLISMVKEIHNHLGIKSKGDEDFIHIKENMNMLAESLDEAERQRDET